MMFVYLRKSLLKNEREPSYLLKAKTISIKKIRFVDREVAFLRHCDI